MINKITIFDPTLFTTEGDEGVAAKYFVLHSLVFIYILQNMMSLTRNQLVWLNRYVYVH